MYLNMYIVNVNYDLKLDVNISNACMLATTVHRSSPERVAKQLPRKYEYLFIIIYVSRLFMPSFGLSSGA